MMNISMNYVSIPYRYYKSNVKAIETIVHIEFQFLIGIINPENVPRWRCRSLVSIPYRYYKFVIPPLAKAGILAVSIPYRYYKSILQ